MVRIDLHSIKIGKARMTAGATEFQKALVQIQKCAVAPVKFSKASASVD